MVASANEAVKQDAVAVGLDDLRNSEYQNDHAIDTKRVLSYRARQRRLHTA